MTISLDLIINLWIIWTGKHMSQVFRFKMITKDSYFTIDQFNPKNYSVVIIPVFVCCDIVYMPDEIRHKHLTHRLLMIHIHLYGMSFHW